MPPAAAVLMLSARSTTRRSSAMSRLARREALDADDRPGPRGERGADGEQRLASPWWSAASKRTDAPSSRRRARRARAPRGQARMQRARVVGPDGAAADGEHRGQLHEAVGVVVGEAQHRLARDEAVDVALAGRARAATRPAPARDRPAKRSQQSASGARPRAVPIAAETRARVGATASARGRASPRRRRRRPRRARAAGVVRAAREQAIADRAGRPPSAPCPTGLRRRTAARRPRRRSCCD